MPRLLAAGRLTNVTMRSSAAAGPRVRQRAGFHEVGLQVGAYGVFPART